MLMILFGDTILQNQSVIQTEVIVISNIVIKAVGYKKQRSTRNNFFLFNEHCSLNVLHKEHQQMWNVDNFFCCRWRRITWRF